MKKCFFIGHRDVSDDVFSLLIMEIEKHIIDFGVTEFIVGCYGNFDHLAAKAVNFAKKKHQDVLLSILLAYHPAERSVHIPEGADISFYPFELKKVPRRLNIVRANKYAVDHSDYLIAYVDHPGSNSQNLLEYAKRKGLHVTNLAGSEQ